jgi:hypothetical protein
VVRSKVGQAAQDIVTKFVRRLKTSLQASYDLKKLNLNIFDILALVFLNPGVKYAELLSPLPPSWSKIEEICRNTSTKNPHQCLLKVIDYVEEGNIFGKTMQRVVSRCVSFAARPLA